MGKLLLCATVLTGTAAASRCRGSWRRSLRVQQAATLLHSTKFKRADAVTLATQAIALAMIYPEPRSSPRGTLKDFNVRPDHALSRPHDPAPFLRPCPGRAGEPLSRAPIPWMQDDGCTAVG